MVIDQDTQMPPARTFERRQDAQRWRYVLSVLLGLDGGVLPCHAECVYYGDEQDAPSSARVIIRPSAFFGPDVHTTDVALPSLPLNQIMGIPLLFGQPKVVQQGGRIVTDADLIASAYFLLTRHEEVVRRDVRDEHGRFPGRASLSCRGGFLERPIVDEYARLLCRWLGQVGVDVPERPRRIRQVYLTHDVDVPWRWGSFRSACSAWRRRLAKRLPGAMEPLWCYFGFQRDPADSFDWILEHDGAVVRQFGPERAESIVFVLAGGSSPYDGYYRISSRRGANLVQRLLRGGVRIGLHASYEAGGRPELIDREIASLARVAGRTITDNRHHFLGSREPEDLRALVRAGIERDFTMAYADVLGFRLGTSRGVRWFDAQRDEVTDLTLCPLTLMDCTLDRPQYMGLDYERARNASMAMLEQTRRHNGDVVLLWHNTELTEERASEGSYHKRLYLDLLNAFRN